MNRIASLALTSILLLGAACGSATVTWRPSLLSHVPDSTPVRWNPQTGEPRVRGRSLGWQNGAPRVVTDIGDTMCVGIRRRSAPARAPFRRGHDIEVNDDGVTHTHEACEPARRLHAEVRHLDDVSAADVERA